MQSGGKIEIEVKINESADYIISSKLLKIHNTLLGQFRQKYETNISY